MQVRANQRLCFGPFELDNLSAELFKFGQKVKLQGQPIQILSILLEKPGELVTREELRQRLWPTETATFVDFDHGLNTDIRKLRQALGDEAETPKYIETLPRRGYRFIGRLADTQDGSTRTPEIARNQTPIAQLTPTASADVANIVTSMTEGILLQRRRDRRIRLLLAVLTILMPLLVFGFLWLRSEPSEPRIIVAKQLTFTGAVGNRMASTVENYASIQSDGRHVFYSVNFFRAEPQLRHIPVGGGNETILPTPIAFPSILHISSDGSNLLVKVPVGPRGDTESALWLLPTDGSGSRKLGDIEAQDAAFAPDGKTIVFAKGQNLYLTDLQGNSPAKLASIPGRAFWLRWSPSGRELRFTIINSDTLGTTLWELRSDGTLHQLLARWKDAGQLCCGVWTADGRYYIFRNHRNDRSDYWVLPERRLFGRSHPVLLSPGGLQITAAAVSPLEKKIFILGLKPSTEMFKLDAEAGRTSPLFPGLQAVRITFSPDGKLMAYITSTGELWLARTDASEKLQLTVAPMSVYMAQYSPDGQRVAFMAQLPNHPWKIYWASSAGGAIHEIASNIVNQADPNWSSDSQSIIFGQPPHFWGGGTGGKRALYRYDLSTEQISEIPGSDGLFSPRLSPDYRTIAAITPDFKSLSLFDFASGSWKLLFHHRVANPAWSPDGRWIYFDAVGPRFWRVRVSDAHIEDVPVPVEDLRCPTLFSGGGFAPDGSFLLTCDQLGADIYALDWE